jgi:tetratricopeptide (TPR) repeat protein
MIKKTSPIALVLQTGDEAALFSGAIGTLGFTNITAFTDSREAYQAAIRKQFDLFVVRIEMLGISGPTFIQKIRETDNYGLETHLVIGNAIDPGLINLFSEYEIRYVLVKPFNFDRITEKMTALVHRENHLLEVEQRIREVRVAMCARQFDLAIELAAKLKPDAQWREKVLLLQGDIEFRRQNYPAARTFYQAALETNPTCIAAAHKIANTYLLTKDFETADKILSQLKDANRCNIKLSITAGLSALMLGKLDEAESTLQHVISLDEDSREARESLTRVFIQGKKFSDLKTTLASSPSPADLLDVLNSEGKKLFAEGKKKESIEVFELCLHELEDRTNTFGIHFNLGQVLAQVGRLEEARTHIKRTIELNPNLAEAARVLEKVE